MSLGDFLTRIKSRWQVLSMILKAASVFVAVGILVAVSYLILTVVRPTYVPLFTVLDPQEAGAIVNELKTLKVPYQLTDQGKTILVPEAQVYETRNQLAGSGLLAGDGKGFELFDQSKFGQSNFEQQVNYQRALQEELRRTVMHINGVQDARVHLVMPAKSVFVDEQGVATASVALTLGPAAKLTPQQVQGIGDLFIGSVEGLTPENLHIVDNAGNILSEELSLTDKPDVLLTKTTVEQLKLQREYEKELEKKIQLMLAKITGQNNYVTTVTADLDFNKQEITSTVNDNPDNLKISEHYVRETGRVGDYGGPVGTDSNITTIPFAQSVNSTDYSREENTVNYQSSTTQETVVRAPGQVKRLSVAVVVNDNTELVKDEAKIKDAVAAAIGFNTERGDQISVTSQYFDDSQQKKDAAAEAQAKYEEEKKQLYIMATVFFIILLLLLILLIAYLMRQRRRRREEMLAAELEEEDEPLMTVAELEPHIPEPADTKQDLLRKMAGDNPNDIAEVIKLWLRD